MSRLRFPIIVIAAKLNTVYITDKQYINSVGQIEHHATLYKDKAKSKKIGTAKWITSTTYPSGNKQLIVIVHVFI